MATDAKASALAELAELGRGLAAAADDQEQRGQKFKQIMDLIGSLDKDDAKALFADSRVQKLIEVTTESQAQSSDDPPGTIYSGMIGGQLVKGFVKKPWTEHDLHRLVAEGKMEMVDYRPMTTRLIIYNGLKRQFVARRPIRVESPFVTIYEQCLDEDMLAEQHAEWLFRKRDRVDNWSIVTNEGARVRGTGEKGHYVAGGGAVAGREEEKSE